MLFFKVAGYMPLVRATGLFEAEMRERRGAEEALIWGRGHVVQLTRGE